MSRLSLLFGTVGRHMRETGVIGGIRSKYHRPHVPLCETAAQEPQPKCLGNACYAGWERKTRAFLVFNHLNERLPPRMMISSQNYRYQKKKKR